ncbi:MAG: TonB family protein [Candidatus Sulfobium sp.]
MFATLVTPGTPAPPPVRKKITPPPAERKKPPAPRIPRPRTRPAPPPVASRPLPPSPEEKPTVPGEGPISSGHLPPPSIPKEGGTAGKGQKRTGRRAEKSARPGVSSRGKSFDLFDRSVTEDIARRDEAGTASVKGKEDTSITMNTRDYLYRPYLSMLRQKIESIWVYPPEAAEKGLYGDLQIRFTIKKDGTLGDVELVRTSGYQMLDNAALRALKEGAPYWPLPDAWGKKEYTILGHFVYSMYGYRIE